MWPGLLDNPDGTWKHITLWRRLHRPMSCEAATYVDVCKQNTCKFLGWWHITCTASFLSSGICSALTLLRLSTYKCFFIFSISIIAWLFLLASSHKCWWYMSSTTLVLNSSSITLQEGHKPHCIISANLNVGGALVQKASNGSTGILVNGREITKSELQILKVRN